MDLTRFSMTTEWCAAGQLVDGDRVVLNNHGSAPSWAGAYSFDEGYLIGLLIGDGTFAGDSAVLSAWSVPAAQNAAVCGAHGIMAAAIDATRKFTARADFDGWTHIESRGEYRLKLAALSRLAASLGIRTGNKVITPAAERSSSEFHRGLLRGLFDTDGSVQGSQSKGVSVRLAQSDLSTLEAAQRMLLRLGIASQINCNRRPAGRALLPDGRGGNRHYETRAQHELVISGENLICFKEQVGFADTVKRARLAALLGAYRRRLNRERFIATVQAVTPDGFEAVYDVQVPGINAFDANGLYAHNCGEQALPAYGSCLLGSVNLTKFVVDPFTEDARFDWEAYRKVVKIFTRMLDNVVEINGLPLPQQRDEITRKRRHGMGFLGLGSTITMLCMKYGSKKSVAFTQNVSREMAVAGWEAAVELSREKGPAPIMNEEFTVTAEMLRKRPEMVKDGWRLGAKILGRVLHARYSRYMQRIAEAAPELVDELAEVGARFTHHTSIAPTGTISLSLANNASNGIEPSFAHHYFRNVIREGKKSKEKIDVFSFELLAYRELVNPRAMPNAQTAAEKLPDYFVSADDIGPKEHVDIQAAAQLWVDSSISKTANVPTDYKYEDFKDIYMYAYDQGLKGCTTFRFNPEAFQGVLVKEDDLKNTTYVFTLEDGSEVEVRGDQEIEYDGEMHTAANLFDALKEGYYGKF
jgi:ribonucleoside-diphosphate reductase alpha chain